MDFNTLLGQLQTQRPDLADSLNLLRQFQNEKKEKEREDSDVVIDIGREEKLTALLEKQKHINKGLLHQFRKLEHNYQLLLDQMDQFAEAIGACPQCWGENIQCPYCRGKGRPGYFPPNPDYYNLYIKPVVNKRKATNSNNATNNNNNNS
jgi:hypothetical protein